MGNAQIFGLSPLHYISPSLSDLNFDKNKALQPMSLEWTNESKSDWLWFIQTPQTNLSFTKVLLLNGLFILPHGSVSDKLQKHFHGKPELNQSNIQMLIATQTRKVMLCPNPIKRQVIDLRLKINWKKNKKLKRYKSDFYLSVNYKFKQHLKVCQNYHCQKEEAKESGTWIDETLINALSQMHEEENADGSVLKFLTFELWEKETGKIVAASFAYLIGSILSDYTFMTLQRDNRSCGNILTKVIGDILSKCLYDAWYWGFRLNYMSEYDKYGGTEMNRSEFANILKKSCQYGPQKIVNYKGEMVLDIIDFIKEGNALIAPLPAWLDSK